MLGGCHRCCHCRQQFGDIEREKYTHIHVLCAAKKRWKRETSRQIHISPRVHSLNKLLFHTRPFFPVVGPFRCRRRRHFNRGWFTFLHESIPFFFCIEAFDSSFSVFAWHYLSGKWSKNSFQTKRFINAMPYTSARSLARSHPRTTIFWMGSASERASTQPEKMNNRKKWELLPTSKFGTQNVCVFHSVLGMLSAGEQCRTKVENRTKNSVEKDKKQQRAARANQSALLFVVAQHFYLWVKIWLERSSKRASERREVQRKIVFLSRSFIVIQFSKRYIKPLHTGKNGDEQEVKCIRSIIAEECMLFSISCGICASVELNQRDKIFNDNIHNS